MTRPPARRGGGPHRRTAPECPAILLAALIGLSTPGAQARPRQAPHPRPFVLHLISPIVAPVQRAFGAATEAGPSTGITYAATPRAPVASPCAGRIAFAAPFRSYGKLLIVECGGAYTIVLAGLGRLAATSGHATRAGETVGIAGAAPLYVELRAKGTPVDPVPFLKAGS